MEVHLCLPEESAHLLSDIGRIAVAKQESNIHVASSYVASGHIAVCEELECHAGGIVDRAAEKAFTGAGKRHCFC